MASDPRWAGVAGRLAGLEAILASRAPAAQDGAKAPPPAADYLRALATKRGFTDPYPAVEALVPDALPEFQVSLAELGADLVSLLGRELQRRHECIVEMAAVEISLPAHSLWKDRSDELGRLGGRLKTAVQRAVVLHQTWSPAPRDVRRKPAPLLETEAIVRKLVAVACSFLDRGSRGVLANVPLDAEGRRLVEAATSLYNLEEDAARAPSTASHARQHEASLKASAIEWVANLLWYTLRFDVPAYPTTSELAFEFSLLAPPMLRTGGALPEAVELVLRRSGEDVPTKLRHNFEFYDDEAPKLTDLHRSLAKALHYCYFRNAKSGRAGARASIHSVVPEDDGGGKATGFLPVAYTTNFDRTLENALEELRIPHHVVFPVVLRPRRHGRENRRAADQEVRTSGVAWAMRTWLPSGGPTEVFHLDDDPRNHGFAFRGPLVIKLHGSPLDPLTGHVSLAGVPGMWEREHFLVLSETSYLETILHKGSLPAWLETHLTDTPAARAGLGLWFLGYSVRDWNIRARLYSQAREVADASKYAVNIQNDPYGNAIFPRIHITPMMGDLNDFGLLLEEALRSCGYTAQEAVR